MARRNRGPLEELIGEIVGGVRAPGEPLPREAALAQQFGVSRGITREVMRALEERGLVNVKHGIGSSVAPREHWDTLDPLVLAALLPGDSGPAVLTEFLETRRIIEVEAAGIAAERATDADLARLDEAFAALEDAAERAAVNPAAEPRYLEADVNYHQVIMGITHNAVLCSLIARIHSAMLEARVPTSRPDLRAEQGLPEHAKIRTAIRARNPSAARRAMRDHLKSVGANLEAWTKHRGSARTEAA
jgi:DNA-binding FadR family transcriptional regulator